MLLCYQNSKQQRLKQVCFNSRITVQWNELLFHYSLFASTSLCGTLSPMATQGQRYKTGKNLSLYLPLYTLCPVVELFSIRLLSASHIFNDTQTYAISH